MAADPRAHFASRSGSRVRSFGTIAVAALLLASCSEAPPSPPDLAEQAEEISKIFETREAYSVRVIDSLVIERFLVEHPEYQVDSMEIREFYHRRRYQFAWYVNDTLSQAASGFFSLVNTADTAYKEVAHVRNRLSELLHDTYRETVPCTSCREQLDLTLTGLFFRFADKKYGGIIARDLRELDWFIPRRKKNYAQLLDSITSGHMDLSPIEPLHPQYRQLKAQLRHYYELSTSGEWEELSLGELRKMEPGTKAPTIPEIRRRLTLLGDHPVIEDSLVPIREQYDSTLVQAVKRFQERHGLQPDGVVGNGVLSALNISPEVRLRSLLLNMERLRWVPERTPPNLLLVNIPEFRLHVYEADTIAWSMDVVVGNSATRTVIFSDSVSQVVFSPTWSVPSSIVRNEILPAMRKDPNYLAKKGMEIVGGTEAMPKIRQKPGGGNALGRVKFLFPNTYSIYLHDTPSRGAFAKESRAFSHGCIRLSEPAKLAEYLLRNDTTWTAATIREAMYKGKEQYVKLKEKRPVSIGYFTAWVDSQGRLNFREDVYGHDERLAMELFDLETLALN